MASKGLTITHIGTSGQQYIFDLYDFMPFSSSESAIYTVGILATNNQHTTLYIGQTNDASKRFRDHHKNDEFIKYGANVIGILLIQNQNDRDIIEKDLISNVQPICNEKLKEVVVPLFKKATNPLGGLIRKPVLRAESSQEKPFNLFNFSTNGN